MTPANATMEKSTNPRSSSVESSPTDSTHRPQGDESYEDRRQDELQRIGILDAAAAATRTLSRSNDQILPLKLCRAAEEGEGDDEVLSSHDAAGRCGEVGGTAIATSDTIGRILTEPEQVESQVEHTLQALIAKYRSLQQQVAVQQDRSTVQQQQPPGNSLWNRVIDDDDDDTGKEHDTEEGRTARKS